MAFARPMFDRGAIEDRDHTGATADCPVSFKFSQFPGGKHTVDPPGHPERLSC